MQLTLVKNLKITKLAFTCSTVCLVSLALARVHVRVQTTLLGYEIGHLKSSEAKLLEERSLLRMQLAKLTTKKHLLLMTDSNDNRENIDRTYALK